MSARRSRIFTVFEGNTRARRLGRPNDMEQARQVSALLLTTDGLAKGAAQRHAGMACWKVVMEVVRYRA